MNIGFLKELMTQLRTLITALCFCLGMVMLYNAVVIMKRDDSLESLTMRFIELSRTVPLSLGVLLLLHAVNGVISYLEALAHKLEKTDAVQTWSDDKKSDETRAS